MIDLNTALIGLIGLMLVVNHFRQSNCDDRVVQAGNEGERRMLAAIRIAKDLFDKSKESQT